MNFDKPKANYVMATREKTGGNDSLIFTNLFVTHFC